MDRLIHKLLPALLLMTSMHAYADSSFLVSPSLGIASISNIDGYTSSPLIRVDGSFHPTPQFAVGVFVASLTDFDSTGNGNDVSIRVNGYGAGVTGKWPVHPHAQPYARLDYMLWSAEATGLDRTLAKDRGGSAGLALGVRFPIKKIFGVKAEFSGYNNVSGANIRQFSVGATFEF